MLAMSFAHSFARETFRSGDQDGVPNEGTDLGKAIKTRGFKVVTQTL